ncbi:helix-turn-helix domain-containing protein [Nocardioides sp.]
MEHLVELGQRVAAARVEKRWSVETAARRAEISRTTWNRVEAGLGVQDVKRAAVLGVLGLDSQGLPIGVAGRSDGAFVSAPGDRVPAGGSSEDVLRAIRAMQEDLRAMSERLARLEQNA